MPKGVRSSSLVSHSSVIIADMVADVQADHRTVDGMNGISKGVILNALQCGQNGMKLSDQKNNESIKDEFNQMSSLRKVAFGFSFLPSIMFVLCFAVIFPCEKILPCLDIQWSTSLNDTKITSNLFAPMNVLFTFSNEDGSGGIRSLSESSGYLLWENNFKSKFLECGKLADPEKQSCLIVDNNGSIHIFDPSNGRDLWELQLNVSVLSVTILPDCNNDGVDEIAVATSNSQIKILSIKNIIIKDCLPLNMMAWKKPNETDIIFICETGENGALKKISQNEWCRIDKNQEVKMSTLTTNEIGILKQSKFLPTNEGFILWTHDNVTKFQNDGHEQWSATIYNHSNKHRFLMNGKFRSDKKEVILYSSDISSQFQVTRLNAKNGETIKTKIIPHLELTEAVLINGQEYDFIFGLKKQLSETKRFSQIKEVSTSVINLLLTNDATSVISNTSIIEESFTLMEIDANDLKVIHSHELDYATSKSYTSSFTVVLKNKGVKLFILRKPQDNFSDNPTSIKSISVSNWDTSSEKTSHCTWKE